MSNRSIPSKHAERKITFCSHKHSFTPYLSLSTYSQMDRITDRETNTLAVHGLEELFFKLCCCVSFLVVVGNNFRCYIPTIQWRNKYTCCVLAGGTVFPVVLLCQFFGFWQEIGFGVTYLRI